jgi:hypothetical protein
MNTGFRIANSRSVHESGHSFTQEQRQCQNVIVSIKANKTDLKQHANHAWGTRSITVLESKMRNMILRTLHLTIYPTVRQLKSNWKSLLGSRKPRKTGYHLDDPLSEQECCLPNYEREAMWHLVDYQLLGSLGAVMVSLPITGAIKDWHTGLPLRTVATIRHSGVYLRPAAWGSARGLLCLCK